MPGGLGFGMSVPDEVHVRFETGPLQAEEVALEPLDSGAESGPPGDHGDPAMAPVGQVPDQLRRRFSIFNTDGVNGLRRVQMLRHPVNQDGGNLPAGDLPQDRPVPEHCPQIPAPGRRGAEVQGPGAAEQA
ncbi:hypothetical protein D9M72_528000 [compost metagenome]